MRQQLDTAIRLSLAGQVRNRFAWILLVAFVPVWYLLIGSMIAHHGAGFRLRATGATLVVDGHNLTLITAGLSSITLITGFVVFAAVRRTRLFDRRLVLSGYRPAALIAAKTGGALVQAVAIGAYAAIILLLFWRPAGIWTIAVSFMLAAATYVALGLLTGVLVRGDLEGFFLIIMISLIDTFLQNPVGNPLANKPLLQFFPSYGPTQFAAADAAASALACHDTSRSSWDRRRPRVLSTARSRRRRCTPVSITWASVPTASRARTAPRMSGVSRTPV